MNNNTQTTRKQLDVQRIFIKKIVKPTRNKKISKTSINFGICILECRRIAACKPYAKLLASTVVLV